ncbi:IS21 family transposase [Brevibacterium samyangense]|uniref:IS21 family transposase n=1 Tax=Brevibacterium samyangense TaxID=366888 RepID=A0ABN2TLS5_9MICO
MVRKIRAKLVLKLRAEGLSGRTIAASHRMSRKSVSAVLDAALEQGITYADIADESEDVVYSRLFPGRGEHESVFTQPDWDGVHRELSRVGVTLKLLHSEYADRCARDQVPAMGYDRFCKTYQRHLLITGAASRVGHKAAQTVEVDWSGPTMRLSDPVTGQSQKVYLFVGCLPFSRYAFVYASTDMRQESWLRAHVGMFEFFGASVPRIVPDNLKTGVIAHPKDGEIVLNDAYRELAAHYSAAVLPGRVRKPKDKPSAENTVWHVAMYVIAVLRDQEFTSLAQLQEAIDGQVREYNRRPFQKREGSRYSVFTAEEFPLMTPLPVVPYEIASWVYGRKVARDGYVAFEKNHYSVPYSFIGSRVDLRITDRTLEVYEGTQRIASHLVCPAGVVGQYRTRDADRVGARRYEPWDAARVREWAGRIGPSTVIVIERIFESVQVLEQGLDSALAVLRLSRRYAAARVEHACALALTSPVRSPRYAHIQPILATGQDRLASLGHRPVDDPEDGSGYVRGGAYYSGGQA